MSSDTQFTALGPTEIGFQTHGARIQKGADVAGIVFGARGTCMGSVGDGVQGVGAGHFSGVAGFGGRNNGTGVFGMGAGASGQGVRGIGAGAPNTSPGRPSGVFGQGGAEADGVHGIGQGRGGAGARGVNFSIDGNGVVGEAHNGTNAYGVWGSSRSGYAGYFDGNVRVNGRLTSTNPVAISVRFSDGTDRALYALESPEGSYSA